MLAAQNVVFDTKHHELLCFLATGDYASSPVTPILISQKIHNFTILIFHLGANWCQLGAG